MFPHHGVAPIKVCAAQDAVEVRVAVNPFESPRSLTVLPSQRGLGSSLAAAAAGAIVAVVASVPLAGIVGLLFRFPVPFADYASGPGAIVPAMYGAVLYGIIGGFPVQALGGCIVGTIAGIISRRTGRNPAPIVLLGGVVGALPGLLLLATLDWIIGPW